MRFPHGRIMVFCKAPEEGKVKTRLAKSLDLRGFDGDRLAVKIHEYLSLHCLDVVTENEIAPVELWCSPDRSHPFFRRCEKEYNIVLKEQGLGDLGERMMRAFESALVESDYAVLVGTDCPGYSESYINRAFSLLSEGHRSVFGPAKDGGYVLIGLSAIQPDIFINMPWGSPHVLDETLQRIKGSAEKLPEIWDVDQYEDLRCLVDESSRLKLDDKFISFLEYEGLNSVSID